MMLEYLSYHVTIYRRTVIALIKDCNMQTNQPQNLYIHNNRKYNTESLPQTRHNNRPVLSHIPITPIALHHQVRRKIQFSAVGQVGVSVRRRGRVGVVRDDGDVVAAAHQLAVLALLAVDVCLEDLHHVLLRVSWLGVGGAVAVGGDVERSGVAVEEFDDVRGRGAVDDG